MSKIVFEADRASRNVTRFLFVLQVTGLILVLCLRLLNLQFPALVISSVTLLVFLASLFWLYSRYRNIPLISEKIRLERLYSKFEKHLLREEDLIQRSMLERERLVQAEREELELARSTLEKDRIGQTYQALQEMNGAAESQARASKELLRRELTSFKPRLQQLAPLTFPRYLGSALSSRGLMSGLLALALMVLPMISTVSAARPMILASPAAAIPSPTQVAMLSSPVPPTHTDVPTLVFTPTVAEILPPTVLPTATGSPVETPQATLPAALALCVPQNTRRETGLVVGVVDGDTIDVQIGGEAGGQAVRVRYIGIDSPEQDQPLYQEALAYNQSLVLNKTVTLVSDTSEADEFNRLLRYVIVTDTFVNQALVEMGFAKATAYAPDVSCVSSFEAAQRQAETARVGLWLSTPESLIAPVTGGEVTPGCDPSYPGVCIPPSPPDLDCGDISFKRFQVLEPDPHRFDGDKDGVGCE